MNYRFCWFFAFIDTAVQSLSERCNGHSCW